MAKKAYRELSEAERKHHSLSARVSRYVVIGAAILGVTMLIIGLALYSVAVSNQYISTSVNLCRSASKVLSELAETEALSGAVMERYNSMSDAERAEVGTEAYDARYSDLMARDDYQDMRALLAFFLESSDVYDIYLGMYDREHSALVYIADPSEEDVALPGYWESVEPAEAEKFLNWDGTGTLYDISNMEKYGWICSAGVPLKNAAGETFAFVLADITLGHVLPKLAMFTLQYTVALAVLILAFGWFMLRYMNRNIVKPINDIAQAAQTYVRDKREDAQTKPVDSHVPDGGRSRRIRGQSHQSDRRKAAHRHGAGARHPHPGGYASQHLPRIPGTPGIHDLRQHDACQGGGRGFL